MSKHKGNVVDPWDALNKQGADAVRWYFYANSAPWLPSRYYDEADDTNISNTISSERAREYIDGLLVNYGVTDVKGELKYLTLEEEAVG